MIDSVTLSISDFILFSAEHFTKIKFQELKGKHGPFARISIRHTEHSKKCKAENRYFPQVHISQKERRWRGSWCVQPSARQLVVQVSLPKLIYGVSILDIDERLLPVIAERLAESLEEIGLRVSEHSIINAVVKRIDYSKILKISPSYGSTSKVLRELAPYEMKQSSDFNRTHYHNGKDGFYLKYFNPSRGFVIYDKFDEIVMNGKTNIEKEIARQYSVGKWKKGALRIELSLQKKQTVEAVLRRFIKTKKKNFTLCEVMSTKIAKTLLMETFEQIYIKNFNRIVRLAGLKDVELLMIINSKKVSFNERTILYYLAHRVREIGLSSAIEELKQEVSPATVGRYKKAVERILGEVEAKRDSVDVVRYLYRKLEKFTPVFPKKLDKILGQLA